MENKVILREQIMRSAIDSFRLEGIQIPLKLAAITLKKVETILGK